ncbi:MAG: fatty acid oxidation complex subunit alpha FadJ [Pseudomonadales bacterium]|uniref:enoyl-CoA hydratase n=1 Tax=Oleiphilus messinensis TaxID=141451 RepID=A0A1Y0IHP1_9GAMM|nr:fatty acid oxidation complex subunit alpha FadJ [Oleiphilus messinensis]ARU59075.1 fatty acid oxidation complex alpha subunit [Oleiphilus messinensis]MCG8609976.1 fatty acid oxidation complex subunit alpha FadJ [Pseudomonadales bacterium]
MNAKVELPNSAFSLKLREDAIGVIEINVPGDAQNTLKAEFADEFEVLFSELQAQTGLQGLVLISTKPGSFVAGADINLFDHAQSADEVSDLSRLCQKTFQRLEDLQIPVVAAIDGACLGGGLELAMACHYRIATSNSSTVLGLPEVMLGLLPAGGGTQRLPRLVGIAKALDMMLTGRQLKAKQALGMGLVDAVVEPEALLVKAVAMAKPRGKRKVVNGGFSIPVSTDDLMALALEKNAMGRKVLFDQAGKKAAGKTLGNYPAPEKIIRAVAAGYRSGLAAGYEAEAMAFGELAMSAVSGQLRNIFHATNELKKETFVGDDRVVPRPVKQIAVLGAGLMGAGIALNTVSKTGLPVRLKDRDAKGLSHGVSYVRKFYDKRVKLGAMTAFDAQAKQAQMTVTEDYRGFAHADLVIEAVFEDLALKHQMLKDTESHGHQQTIFASNTSSIPISDIAKAAARPENVIGMHYFSPVEKMPLLEIITHEQTAPEVTAACVEFGKAQGKTVIVVKDGPGFYTTRILAPYLNEASRLLLEGFGPKDLDKALMQLGYPVGPITLLDEVGIDVGTKVGPILEAAFGERMASPEAANLMIENGFLGRKAGKGFYLYGPEHKGKPVNDAVYNVMGVSASRKNNTAAELQEAAERCNWMLINEAAFCLQEGILQQPMHGDIGAIFGLGFPPFLGGPFRYMDTLGLDKTLTRLEQLAATYGKRFEPAPIIRDMAAKKQTFYPAR